jgi:hypothetical protein
LAFTSLETSSYMYDRCERATIFMKEAGWSLLPLLSGSGCYSGCLASRPEHSSVLLLRQQVLQETDIRISKDRRRIKTRLRYAPERTE